MNQESVYAAPESQVMSQDLPEFQEVRIMSATQRIGRARFLAYNTAAYFLLFIPAMIMGAMAPTQAANPSEFYAGAMGIFVIVGYIGLVVWGFIVGIRRLHDLDHTGWLTLIYLIPFVNIAFGLYVLFAPGTQGANKYGARPSPNTTGTWIMATLFPLIIIIGIVAAIALPAYQDYSERAKAAQISE
ncbi:DUF805 domain-containing protein [Aliikangiella marina]|uniref:DUF805 domain-containing protein n=1 Tax=Aliikangiella marina TaxID=1712262 RepID=A0A545T9Q1_9GAMM|nr:DUF805 domain-containing protein [Aliikangiella marina]TQV73934.1 DUF805 domain-containing protein [Aliikangiella marina]